MKKLLSIFILISSSNFAAKPTKTLRLTGAITAPWVKGQICANYWYKQKYIKNCFDIETSKEYKVSNIPHRVRRVKVTRTFAKQCKIVDPQKKCRKLKCRKLKGNFDIKQLDNNLNLTYDHNNILKFYTIPPKEPESIFGYPRSDPSIRFMKNYNSDAYDYI